MEKMFKGRDPESRKFFAFADKITRRVSDIGRDKKSTVRSAQRVVEVLHEATNGEADKVTDEMIASTFDEVDAE